MNKSWFNTKRVALQNTQEGIDRVCSEQLVDAGKHLLPEFSEYKFGGQLRHTNVVAWRSFRAVPGNRANGVVKACMGKINQYMVVTKHNKNWIMCIWVRSRNCSCLVTWFCYQLIAKPDVTGQLQFRNLSHIYWDVLYPQMEMSCMWQPQYSLETLKTSFDISSGYQNCNPNNPFISVWIHVYGQHLYYDYS